jgi:hypothetical protein
MKKGWILLASVTLFLGACKQKKEKEGKEPFIPVLSFINSQVADVDTSLNPIRKITYIDSLHNDTVYVKREEFRGLAKDFLEMPDLMEKKYSDHYTEEKRFDETMNRVIISYVPDDPENEDIQKLDVLMTPNSATGDKLNNLIIERLVSNKDGYIHKMMLWQVDRSFQVTTTTQKPGQPESTSTYKVTWNE